MTVVGGSILAAPLGVEAQQAGKVWRIGVLQFGSPTEASTQVLRGALRDLGYVEGQNIVIEDRMADGRLDRLPDLAAELVRKQVDVSIASGVAGTRAAERTTTKIPIVMLATDPLGAGLISSLARPGGNITGVATLESELGAKRLEHFKEAFPTVARVAALYDPTTSTTVLRGLGHCPVHPRFSSCVHIPGLSRRRNEASAPSNGMRAPRHPDCSCRGIRDRRARATNGRAAPTQHRVKQSRAGRVGRGAIR